MILKEIMADINKNWNQSNILIHIKKSHNPQEIYKHILRTKNHIQLQIPFFLNKRTKRFKNKMISYIKH